MRYACFVPQKELREHTGAVRLVRLLPAAFLGFWLCGWAMGEYFAGSMLVNALAERLAPGVHVGWLPPVRSTGTPTIVLAFLGVWVTFWTLGGVMAMGSLLELLVGQPILRWNDRHLDVVTQVGPFSRRKRIPLAGVREVTPGPMRTLVITGAHGKLPSARSPTTPTRRSSPGASKPWHPDPKRHCPNLAS